MKNTDILILDQIIDAQNKINALSTKMDIAEFCAQTLVLVPGINSCCVCLGDAFSKAGEISLDSCIECKAKRINESNKGTIPRDFVCKLEELSDVEVFNLETADYKFGFFVCRTEQVESFEPYKSVISNLASFVAISMENRLQKKLLKEIRDNFKHNVEKQVKEGIQENEKHIRHKPDVILSPDTDIDSLELSDILDSKKIQKMMDEFYKLTKIGIGIIDLHGNVLVGTGWQDICTKFHRVNPESCKLCIESDLELSRNVPFGTFKQYKCKNNMWDIATPIMLGNRHMGNIFLGQFLFDDETPDYEVFRKQALRYGFNEQEYLLSLERVPRWSMETVNAAMSFYTAFAGMIGNLSYSNIKLANALEERKRVEDVLNRLNRELRVISNCNQALLRAYEEQPLLNEICRIICDKAGYCMAWVGYTENDSARTVRPIAWAGVEEGYLATANITWVDMERECGTGGTTIHDGASMCIQNFATDPRALPWREDALRRGYQSSIALPLKDENANTFGALVIYSIQSNAFTQDEIRILEELAGDLAFGIIALRTKAERKRSEEALRISEERFSKIFRLSPIAIIIFRVTDNRIVDVNDIFLKQSGFTREEVIGHTSLELQLYANPDDRKYILQTLKEQGSIENFEFNMRNKSGAIRIGLTTTIEMSLGKEKHYLSLIQDITERKQTEIDLIKAKEKAEESDHLKTAFLCNMSHEIRTPMNAIIGFSEFLFDPGIPSDKKQQFSEIIKERSYDLLRIVEDILDISKIEVGQMKIIESDVNLGSLMSELYEYYVLKISQTRKQEILLLNLLLADNLINTIVKTDGQRLKQILNNLLDNALKFTKKGSIEFGCKVESDSELLFFVKDTGIGISDDKQEIIFDRFRQAEDLLSTRQYGGTGLGLSIVKGLVILMGGKVWLESQVGSGTTFYFTLPLKMFDKNDKFNLKNKNANSLLSWRNKTILIVEDDEPNAEYLKVVLSGKEVQILLAYTGKEALQIIKSNPAIDLVLMDIRLPDTNGLNITRIIKKNNPQIVVIAQTAYASSADMKDCIDAGCSDYISKPINSQKMVALIDNYLHKKLK